MKKPVIYKIINDYNEIYIGATVDIIRRKREHKSRKHGHKGEIFIIYQFPEDVKQCILNNYEEFVYKQFKEVGCKMLNFIKPGNIVEYYEESRIKMRKAKIGGKQSEKHINKRISKFTKSIEVYDKNGNFIKDFISLKEASIELNVKSSNISNCLKGKRKSLKDFIFKYKKKECTYP